jgi:hypothetical protein
MIQARPSSSLPRVLFRGYQAALVVIALIYALILVVLIPSGFFNNFGEAIRLIGSLFFLYLAPGTYALLFAIFLFASGKRPGPYFATFSLLAAFWTIVAGYNVVLT